jgi:NAD(P)H-dependent flavin oxidoreductase YrpB (nitropropane dioxygenase family)
MPSLTIGTRTARLPIIQGGMAVRISLAPLAAAVANAGGIGIIAGSGLTPEELHAEIRLARSLTDGPLGVNIMVAIRGFKEVAQAALDEGIDFMIAGAGFSREVFEWCREAGTEMIPIVGSVKAAQLSQRLGASAVVVESVEAGGHLGTDLVLDELLPPIVEAVDIPVIGAGNIATGADIAHVLEMGAVGVQMGTRFALTKESSAADEWKARHIEATEADVVIIQSPVGLPGRALRTPLTEKLEAGTHTRTEPCRACLKKCGKEFCIVTQLEEAQQGDIEHGLVFAGQSVTRIFDIPATAELMARLEREYDEATQEEESA